MKLYNRIYSLDYYFTSLQQALLVLFFRAVLFYFLNKTSVFSMKIWKKKILQQDIYRVFQNCTALF